MSEHTDELNLRLYQPSENFDITGDDGLNSNFTIIDEEVGKLSGIGEEIIINSPTTPTEKTRIIVSESFEEVEYAEMSDLDEKTSKVRIDFDGTNFKIDGQTINYQELYEAHLPSPDFAFVVYGDRAYLLSYVQDDAGMKEMRFQSVLAVTDANNLSYVKTSGIYVISTDGVNIASVRVTDINSENKAYKVTAINGSNRNSDVMYPSVKAVADADASLSESIVNTKEDLTQLLTGESTKFRVLEKAYVEATGGVIQPSVQDDLRIAFVSCNRRTAYHVTKKLSKAFRVFLTYDVPKVGERVYSVITNTNGTSIDITTGDNDTYYLGIYYCYNDPNPSEILSSIKVTSDRVAFMNDVKFLEKYTLKGKKALTELPSAYISESNIMNHSSSGSSSIYYFKCGKVERYAIAVVGLRKYPDNEHLIVGYTTKEPKVGNGLYELVRTDSTFECEIVTPTRAEYVVLSIPQIRDNVFVVIRTVNQDYIEEIPKDYPVEVGFKKSQQWTNLRWTPKKPVPKLGGASYWPENEERIGMLYGEGAYQDKRVGIDVTLRTFMTALNNPYSLLYTENTNYSHSKSAYGKTYYGDYNSGAYMAMSCNIFVYNVLGSKIPYSSYETEGWVADEGIVERIFNQSAYGVELLDILSNQGHCKVVTRIWRNERNVATNIQTSEIIESGAVNTVYSISEFNAMLRDQNYHIYRYRDLFKNIDYVQSPFVTLDGETKINFKYNDDICTFAGDYASFAEGDLLHINYEKGVYTSMQIYKNDVLIDTISIDGGHDVDLTNKGYTYGKYKARLTNGSQSSDFTYWEILNLTLALSGETATFSTANGTPVFWSWCEYRGYHKRKHQMDSTVKNGTINVGLKPDNEYHYLKVYVDGDYGRIARRVDANS